MLVILASKIKIITTRALAFLKDNIKLYRL